MGDMPHELDEVVQYIGNRKMPVISRYYWVMYNWKFSYDDFVSRSQDMGFEVQQDTIGDGHFILKKKQ